MDDIDRAEQAERDEAARFMRRCPRCAGSGHWVEKDQVCFRCNGTGSISSKPKDR